jgi:dnd system-associated protein 4
MAESRIRIAKDKAELVRALKDGSDVNGPFKTYADVVAFAAALGAQRGIRTPFKEVSDNPEPIPQEIFLSRKYDKLIQLLAIFDTKDPKILVETDSVNQDRVMIFEEYANTGLAVLSSLLSGSIDHMDQAFLIVSNERVDHQLVNGEFDLSKFMPS